MDAKNPSFYGSVFSYRFSITFSFSWSKKCGRNKSKFNQHQLTTVVKELYKNAEQLKSYRSLGNTNIRLSVISNKV